MRRLLIALVLSGMALAALVLPAGAQAPPPAITLNPTSDAGGDSGTWSIVVSGARFRPNLQVTFAFAGTAVATSPSPVVASSTGTFTANITPARRSAGLYDVFANQGNPCAPTSSCPTNATAQFRSVPRSSYNDPCGPIGDTVPITITGSFFPPKSFGYVFYDRGGPEEQNRQRIPTGSGTFTVTFDVVIPSRPITINVYDVNGNTAPDIVWRPAPCSTTTIPTTTEAPTTTEPATVPPTVTVTSPPTRGTTTTSTSTTIPPVTPGATLVTFPAVGPPGFVARAVGTGFTAGAVELSWVPGIGKTVAIVGPDGAFTTQVLIMPKDRRGPRSLVATGGGVTATASFLVVAPTVQPSSGSDITRINLSRRLNNR